MSFRRDKTERKEIVYIDCGKIIYNKYKHTGITELQYGMDDKELDNLVFTNYQNYALILEQKTFKKH